MPSGDAARVRPAVLADAPAIGAVHVQAWKDAYRGLGPDTTLDGRTVEGCTAIWERGIPRGGVWVGLADGEVAGFAAVGPSRDPDAEFELYAIYVLASSYDTGLGYELARAVLDGRPDVGLWVFEQNPRARRFYERLGFRTDGVEKAETIDGVELKEPLPPHRHRVTCSIAGAAYHHSGRGESHRCSEQRSAATWRPPRPR